MEGRQGALSGGRSGSGEEGLALSHFNLGSSIQCPPRNFTGEFRGGGVTCGILGGHSIYDLTLHWDRARRHPRSTQPSRPGGVVTCSASAPCTMYPRRRNVSVKWCGGAWPWARPDRRAGSGRRVRRERTQPALVAGSVTWWGGSCGAAHPLAM